MPVQTSAKNSIFGVVLVAAVAAGGFAAARYRSNPSPDPEPAPVRKGQPGLTYQPRKPIDTGGFSVVVQMLPAPDPAGSMEWGRKAYDRIGFRALEQLDRQINAPGRAPEPSIQESVARAQYLGFEGQSVLSYESLERARVAAEADPEFAREWLYTIIYFQGVMSLRRGEDENCVLCRGESSCILPISPAAVHTKPAGSRQAIRHFTEYLDRFPDDLPVRWLLNLAHMTLGDYPAGVDSRYLVRIDPFLKSEFDIGRFRDIGHLVGVNRLNEAGGAIMEDFDGDGLLDLVVTTMEPTKAMAFYKNKGDGTFEERTEAARLTDQLGGLYCVQTDYNNDGFPDVFICRGAWWNQPFRPSLLRNNGDGTFTDVTEAAGMAAPLNSISATWADFDNDGFLDVFVCNETGPNRLYRNKGDGTFEEVAGRAGVRGRPGLVCKGAAWIDYDGDGYPDLFLSHINGPARLFHNERNGTFTDVSEAMGIDGPHMGFSCWSFDFDNDGWPDIFATDYNRDMAPLVMGLEGRPNPASSSRLYRNLQGKGFRDMTREAGLEGVYMTMGSNFGDLDNDGYLDFYLGTGNPLYEALCPSRMFKNVGGQRFAEITASSGTGHLQKGHGVAIGDWDRDGNVDLFMQTGGAIPGDRYHNVLFQNPGQKNRSLTVKLVGKKSNRPGVGARIKAVTAGPDPLTVYRHVSSGSSFGANPYQQTLGLGSADRVAVLEVYWPTSGTTQTFRDIPVGGAIEVTEFATEYKTFDWKPIPVPR